MGCLPDSAHEEELVAHALNRLVEEPDVTVYGPSQASMRTGVVSFDLEGVHPHDVAQILDETGIAVRAGHHCAQVLHERLGVRYSSFEHGALQHLRKSTEPSQLCLYAGFYERIALSGYPQRSYASPTFCWSAGTGRSEGGRAQPRCGDELG